MCDCYWQGCKVCGADIPVHIGDYRFPRTAVEVWCGKHIPHEAGVEIFVIVADEDGDDDEESEFKIGERFGIRLCGGERVPPEEDVCPNLMNAEPLKQEAKEKA